MTYNEFQRTAWKSLPRIRRTMAGRQAVEDCIRVMVRSANAERLSECGNEEKRQAYRVELAEMVRLGYLPISGRSKADFGMFWLLILQAIVISLVQWFVTWWLNHRHPKDLLKQWKRQLS